MSSKKEKTKKDRRLRIFWSSNGSWTGSGYGVFTRDLLTRLVKDGWPVAQLAFFGLEGSPIEYHGMKVYPKMADPYGSDALVEHGKDWMANVIFTMQDVWTLQPQHLEKLNTWLPYLPLDQSPVSPQILNNLRYAYKIITFSKFGQKQLEDAGFVSEMIYEGTDTEIFKPMDMEACRKELGLPQDAFFFGMVSANKENPPRKGYQEVLEAFKKFHDNNPEAAIFFHTQQISPGSFPILPYAKHLGIADRTFFLNQYVASFKSDSWMVAKEMNAIDVYLQPSMTEGFGLTTIEAQACGKPVIVNNCQSQPELVIKGKTGEVCDTNYSWWRNMLGYVHTADVNSLHDRMEKLYRQVKSNRNQTADWCRNHIVENFNIDTIFREKWIPLMEELQEEIFKSPSKN